MYTTLSLLKQTKACIPGYSRMVAFFGTNSALKEVKIPIHAVALIGDEDDCAWAAEHSMIIDPEAFDRFYRRHLVSVLTELFWSAHREYGTSGLEWEKHPAIVQAARREILQVVDYESAVAWITKFKHANLQHWIWTKVLAESHLHMPGAFINRVIDRYSRQEYTVHSVARRHPELLDLDSVEPDQSPRPRTLAARMRAEAARPYYFPSAEGHKTKALAVAHMLTEDDPYASIVDMMAKNNVTGRSRVKGMMLSQANDKQPPGYHLTLNLSDPEKIFRVFHMLNANDFNINKLLGVDSIASDVDAGADRLGVTSDARGLDQLTLVNGELVRADVVETSEEEDDDTEDTIGSDGFIPRHSNATRQLAAVTSDDELDDDDSIL